MNDKEDLCRKLTEIYPEIEECGIDVDFYYDGEKNAWVVDLVKDQHELIHYLDAPEADDCLEGNKCASLGLEIARLKKNIVGKDRKQQLSPLFCSLPYCPVGLDKVL